MNYKRKYTTTQRNAETGLHKSEVSRGHPRTGEFALTTPLPFPYIYLYIPAGNATSARQCAGDNGGTQNETYEGHTTMGDG